MSDRDGLWAGRYRRERLLGRGAMGEVWLARDVVLDRDVAIKSIAAELVDVPDLERMTREARVAARINHPNAVNVYDLVTVDGRPNLVMEAVEGTTLDDLIAQRGRLDPSEVERIGAAVADALAEAHRLGIAHRDIKPANILVTPRGTPKLADFGIARAAGDANVTATGATIGTPAYLAPEIVQGTPADARSDVWSLGVTLYTALEGTSPFVLSRQDDPMVVLGRVLTAPVRPPSAGGPVGQVVMAMLDRDPGRRPSAEGVAQRLREARTTAGAATAPLAAGSGTTQLSPDRASLPYSSAPPYGGGQAVAQVAGRGRPKSRRRLVLAVAVLAVAAVGATAGVLLATEDRSAPVAQGGGPSATSGSSGGPSGGVGVGATLGRTYRGPAGIVVTGPTGWTKDTTDTNAAFADYLAPGTTERHHGEYFRLGVFDEHAPASIEQTAKDARAFVLDSSQSMLTHASVLSTHYAAFLGTRAVDVEWTGVNVDGLARHGIERLWNDGGVTREIILNTRAARWSATESVFAMLVANARVTG